MPLSLLGASELTPPPLEESSPLSEPLDESWLVPLVVSFDWLVLLEVPLWPDVKT